MKFKDFQAPVLFWSTFKALNLGKKSSTFKDAWEPAPNEWLVPRNWALHGKLILRKIIKIVSTRCHILKPKCTKFDFGRGSASEPVGGIYSTPPDLLAGFKGPTSKGEEGTGREEGREKKDT